MSVTITAEIATRVDAFIESALRAGRIPGGAIAIAADGKLLFARAYGYRDLELKRPTTTDTVYPIASTSKAFNATLIGMLVDEGLLAWDAPVRSYLPWFGLEDPLASSQVTVRDLLAMRTGLPRHDWVWIDNPLSRASLVARLKYLEMAAGFRERFQYNNLTATAAGHVAEIVAGEDWERLVHQRIFAPLGMASTGFAVPATGHATLSYHEDSRRQITESRRLSAEVTAPSGGAIHSTVEDMARWMLFNLNGGKVGDRQMIRASTLKEIQAPQVVASRDLSCPTPDASYAMGWWVDTYNGHPRLSHAGYLHDVHSEVALFPRDGIGIVSFTNFGFPRLSGIINQHAFDFLMGLEPEETLEQRLAEYERMIVETRNRNAAIPRVRATSPSHPLTHYAGLFSHPGYGNIEIQCDGDSLVYRRPGLELSVTLEHWHYDVWVAKDPEIFFLHAPHAFDRATRISFETNVDGDIDAVLIPFEPAVSPIRFVKQSSGQ